MTLAILLISTGLQCVGLTVAVRRRNLAGGRHAWTLMAAALDHTAPTARKPARKPPGCQRS